MIIYHMICTTFNIMMVGWFWQSNLGFISWVNLSIKYKVLLLGFGFQKHHPSPWLLFANYQHTQVTSIGIKIGSIKELFYLLTTLSLIINCDKTGKIPTINYKWHTIQFIHNRLENRPALCYILTFCPPGTYHLKMLMLPSTLE